MTDLHIEQEILARNLTAPRITPADLENTIVYESYFTAGDGYYGRWLKSSLGPRDADYPAILDQVTICCLLLKNGTKVIGVNTGPVSPGNFDAELGRKLARSNATDQIWPMLGYELRTKLAEQNAKS